MRIGRRAAVFAVLMGLAACASAPPPAPPPIPRPKPLVLDPLAACFAALDARHVAYQREPDWVTPEGCGIEGAVKVSRATTDWNRPGLMSCALAERLSDFESDIVEPAARALLKHSVTKISNAGAYDCRGQRSNHPERMSEHAFGKAFDITGFELDDGTIVSVLRDWPGNGPKAQFLKRVARESCKIFSVVLTPDSNSLHQNHIHLDIGPVKHCGVS